MSIKLDWEVESEGGWAEIGEDEAARLARQRQIRRARTLLGVIIALALLVGGGVGIKLYTADQQLRADLRATVAAETSAIRIGDSAAYLDIQESVGSWRQMQADRFNQYQADKAHVKADGQIVSLDMDGGNGRVVVREMVDDKAYNVVWFYQHEDDGWKHVPPEVAYWGYSHELDSPHYAISYWDEDAAFVTKLQERLDIWWDAACRLTGCHDGSATAPAQMKIRIEPDPLLQLGWAAYDPTTLRVPSPLLGRVPADGSIDPALEQQLAGYVAQQWEQQLIGGAPNDYSDLAWAHDEFRRWLVASFVADAPPAPLFGPLAEDSGGQAILALIGRIKQGEDVPQAIQDVTGKGAGDMPLTWDLYLAYRLRAEVALSTNNHAQEAILLYRDPERSNGTTYQLKTWLTLQSAKPETITVASTQQVGDLLWAEVHFTRTQPGADTPVTSVIEEPFRMVDGRWVHTTALVEEYGEAVTEHTQHITLSYEAIDKPTVEGLLPSLEQQYQAVASDLGISQLPPLQIQISHTVDSASFSISPPPGFPLNSADGIVIWIGSPHSAVFPGDQPLQTSLLNTLTQDMAVQMAGYGTRQSPQATLAMAQAIGRWEVTHLGLTPPDMTDAADQSSPPGSLDALWSDENDVGAGHAAAVGADVLIQLIVEKKGPAAIPVLLKALPLSTGMDGWLSQSVGLHSADLEAEWELRLRAALPRASQP